MMTLKSGFAERAVEHVLELSAEAQIERRKTEKSSAAFQTLTGAIAAYGNVLALLTTLQAVEELDVSLVQWAVPECAAALTN